MADELQIHNATTAALRDHSRQFGDMTYVYPVISRRSQGLSIGINLQPSGACNFDCIYCCVDRSRWGERKPPMDTVDLDTLRIELRTMLALVMSGELWKDSRFAHVDPSMRRLSDIAFSGNGEPTISPQFPEAIEIALEERCRARFEDSAHLVIITNATALYLPRVTQILNQLDQANTQWWCKLDSGDPDHYRAIDRTNVPFEKVLDSIRRFGQARPITIQTMLCETPDLSLTDELFAQYAARLRELIEDHCQIQCVQLYTVARKTAVQNVQPIDTPRLEKFAQQLHQNFPSIRVETHPAP